VARLKSYSEASERRPVDRAAAVQGQPDLAADVPLGLVDERVQRALERREPQPVVDELAPALVHPALEAGQIALHGHVLQLLVRGDQRDRARGSYTSRLLMPTSRSSTMSSRPRPARRRAGSAR
jgi:hypothetical protein